MLPSRDSFLLEGYSGIGICGCYIPQRDSVHVGLFWDWDGESKVAHFVSNNSIKIADINEAEFKKFYFNKLENFPSKLIDSLTIVAELTSKNLLNTLSLSIENVVYIDGKFDVSNGYYLVQDGAERNINCAIFVIALLNTYNYKLIDIDTWPTVTDATKRKYLEDWLDMMKIIGDERNKHYQHNKEIRGKEILISPNTPSKPSIYSEAEPLSKDLIAFLAAEYSKFAP